MTFETELNKIERKFRDKESRLDNIIVLMRDTIRRCSNSIKLTHTGKLDLAYKEIVEIRKIMKKLLAKKYYPVFSDKVNHIAQEYTEAEAVYSIVKYNKIPKRSELFTTDVGYIYGLLDTVGELKREIYESIIYKNGKNIQKYYEFMRKIYDSLLPFRFSNALLKEFRRKQDVARIQIEQSSGDIIRMMYGVRQVEKVGKK